MAVGPGEAREIMHKVAINQVREAESRIDKAIKSGYNDADVSVYVPIMNNYAFQMLRDLYVNAGWKDLEKIPVSDGFIVVLKCPAPFSPF